MTDLEIMQRAKQYIDALANGYDPLSGHPVREDDIVNQVRISRCLFYVSGVLQKVIDNDGEVQKTKIPRRKKLPFSITQEQLSQLKVFTSPVSISRLISQINSFVDEEKMRKLNTPSVNGWLISIGMLEEFENEQGRKRKRPTPNGEMLGMKETSFINEQGVPTSYTVYDKNAQQFIFDNLEAIIAFIRESEAAT